MPRGPKGEKRPADVIGNAVHVMRIATGEIEETPEPRSAAAELGSRGGKGAGGEAAQEAVSGDSTPGGRDPLEKGLEPFPVVLLFCAMIEGELRRPSISRM
jgi:hypothetical protein